MNKWKLAATVFCMLALLLLVSACAEPEKELSGEASSQLTAEGNDASTAPDTPSDNFGLPDATSKGAEQDPEKEGDGQQEDAPQPSAGANHAPDSEETAPTEPPTEDDAPTEPPAEDDAPTEPPTEDDAPTEPPTEDDAEIQAQIDALIARTYALCDEYTARLAALEAAALAEYNALQPEKRTEDAVRAIALYYADQAYYLEGECDAIMDEICAELSFLLLKIDGDLTLVNDVRYAYAQKKAAEKARFMSAYAGYL